MAPERRVVVITVARHRREAVGGGEWRSLVSAMEQASRDLSARIADPPHWGARRRPFMNALSSGAKARIDHSSGVGANSADMARDRQRRRFSTDQALRARFQCAGIEPIQTGLRALLNAGNGLVGTIILFGGIFVIGFVGATPDQLWPRIFLIVGLLVLFAVAFWPARRKTAARIRRS